MRPSQMFPVIVGPQQLVLALTLALACQIRLLGTQGAGTVRPLQREGDNHWIGPLSATTFRACGYTYGRKNAKQCVWLLPL